MASDIVIDPAGAITVTWDDGHRSRFPLPRLRGMCPCARCDELRRAGRPVWAEDHHQLRVAGAELVGALGLGVAWSDGHATGVYQWALLRAACDCPTCSAV
jgi:DUF971 family protein